MKLLVRVGLFLSVGLVPGTVSAGGLYLQEFGTPAMGAAGAGAQARADDASTAFFNPAGINPWGIGVNVGSRWGFTDKMGIALRFEYGHFDSQGTNLTWVPGQLSNQLDLIALTGTFDYMLADGLVFKIEGKYENAFSAKGAFNTVGPQVKIPGSNRIFPLAKRDQFIIGGQLVYSF